LACSIPPFFHCTRTVCLHPCMYLGLCLSLRYLFHLHGYVSCCIVSSLSLAPLHIRLHPSWANPGICEGPLHLQGKNLESTTKKDQATAQTAYAEQMLSVETRKNQPATDIMRARSGSKVPDTTLQGILSYNLPEPNNNQHRTTRTTTPSIRNRARICTRMPSVEPPGRAAVRPRSSQNTCGRCGHPLRR
jgi:hypothetical protein